MITTCNYYSEDTLVEQPAIELFCEHGWNTANCFHEKFDAHGTLRRETTNEGVLLRRTRDLLLSNLISGEVDASELDIETGEPVS